MTTAFPYKKEKGPNGLTAIYVPMKNTKTVAIMVLVGVGSRYETKEINGLSHFLEHMVFKGTAKRPTSLDITQELDAVGAEYNAFTDKEVTGYHVKVDSSHAELAMDVVSDIFLHSTIPAEEIEKERGVILGEIDMYEDDPRRKIWDLFEAFIYPNHPVGWDIAGPKSVIKRLKRDEFIKYRERFYKAGNTVVVVAGNIALDKARRLVKDYLNDIPSGRAGKPLPLKEYQARPQLKIHFKKTDQTHIIIGARAFHSADPRRWPLMLGSVILGGNMSSWLFKRIRDELGLGYYIRAGSSLATDHGYFSVWMGVHNHRAPEAVGAVIEELGRLKKTSVSDAELKKAREYIKGGTLIGLESSDELAAFYGFQQLLERKILTPEQKFSMINKVTRGDIKKVAQGVLRSNKLNLALIGPHRNDRPLKKLLKL